MQNACQGGDSKEDVPAAAGHLAGRKRSLATYAPDVTDSGGVENSSITRKRDGPFPSATPLGKGQLAENRRTGSGARQPLKLETNCRKLEIHLAEKRPSCENGNETLMSLAVCLNQSGQPTIDPHR